MTVRLSMTAGNGPMRAATAVRWMPALLFFCSGAFGADTGVPENPVLRGIAAVELIVDGVEGDLAPGGLDRAELIGAASERLGAAGIALIESGELAQRTDAASLVLRVRVIRAPYYFYLYSINLSLHAKLSLAHNPGAYTTTEVWSEGSLGMAQPSDLAPLRDLALQLVDRFIADHARQNTP